MISRSLVNSSRWYARLLLFVLIIIQLEAVVYFYHSLRITGYLPSPFFYNKNNTFMDLFNPMFWAGMHGRYESWHSVYPPLNFFLLDALRDIFVAKFPFQTAAALRAHSGALEIVLCVGYLLLPAMTLSLRAWREFTTPERVMLYLAAITSLPFLFALERGNLILLVPLLLLLLYDDRPAIRIFSMALLINLKPYFALLLLAYAARRWWNELVLTVVVTGTLYLGTCALIGANFTSLLLNLVHFGQSTSVFSLRGGAGFPSSVSAFAAVLVNPRFLASKYAHIVPDPIVLAVLINAVKWLVIAWSLIGLFRRGRKLEITEIFAVLIVMTSNFAISVGGYSLIFYLAIIPAVVRMGFAKWYLLLLVAIIAPLDSWVTLFQDNVGFQVSYLTGRVVDVFWKLGLATALRPLLNLGLLMLMAIEMNLFPKVSSTPPEGIAHPINHDSEITYGKDSVI